MGLFSSAPVSLEPDIEGALIETAEWRVKSARKDAARKIPELRDHTAKCGGSLRAIAYSNFDGFLVITSEAFYDPLMGSVVGLPDIRSVEVASLRRLWSLAIFSSTQPVITYRVESPAEAYTIQELLGFN